MYHLLLNDASHVQNGPMYIFKGVCLRLRLCVSFNNVMCVSKTLHKYAKTGF